MNALLHLNLFLLVLISAASPAATAGDTLSPGSPLADVGPSPALVSSGGHFAVGFFSPGNSTNRYIGVWYNDIPVQTIVWVANAAAPIAARTGSLHLTGNGTLILSSDNSSTSVVWSSYVSALASMVLSPVAQILDSGNFVVRSASDNSAADYAWQSFQQSTDTQLPTQKLGVNLSPGSRTSNFTAWTSASNPAQGTVRAEMVVTGDPEIYLWIGSQKVWRSGPWDGLAFTGVPEATTYTNFTFNFDVSAEGVTYSYNVLDSAVKSRLVVNSTGQMQRSVWVESTSSWSIFWSAPDDTCDNYAECGPNGLCNINLSPVCECLPGFTPRSPANWELRDATDGCVRLTQLDCGVNSTGTGTTDGFVKISQVKTPDTTNSTVVQGVSLDECQTACLSNCSCAAYASANVSAGGSGCVMWPAPLTDIRVYTDFGPDLYVRLAQKDLPAAATNSSQSGSFNGSNTGAVVGIVLGVIAAVTLTAVAGFCIWRKKRKHAGAVTIIGQNSYSYGDEHPIDLNAYTVADLEHELPLFSFDDLAAATGDFSPANKLGQGGFGPVYKGKLQDGTEIAVKRLARNSGQGLEEFKNEVKLIAKLQHRNLVRLFGCCIHGDERILVYEYMENKSLDGFIFDETKRAKLDWTARYRIIDGIARGILYLHYDSRFRIIHRDLKASNVLLDKDMNPKISDFGMARVFGDNEMELNTRKVVGTYGYMSPEYAMDGTFSIKSDVFSFGVLVLEILSGRHNRGVYVSSSHQNLLAHAWSLWNEGNALELVVEKKMAYELQQEDDVLKCFKLGLLCVQEHPEDRPSMRSVLLMLAGDMRSMPRPKQPGFTFKRVAHDTESSSSKPDNSLVENFSITIMEGR